MALKGEQPLTFDPQALRDSGVNPDELPAYVSLRQQGAIPPVARTGSQNALYYAGMAWGLAKDIVGVTLGQFIAVPGSRECVVLERRHLPSFATTFEIGVGTRRFHLGEDEQPPTGKIVFKAPWPFERAHHIDVTTRRWVRTESQVQPELSGLGFDFHIKFSGLTRVGDPRLVVERFTNTQGAYNSFPDAVSRCVVATFADETVNRNLNTIVSTGAGEKRIPLSEIANELQSAITAMIEARSRHLIGIDLEAGTGAVDVRYPESLLQYADAIFQAMATRVEGEAKAYATSLTAQAVTEAIKPLVETVIVGIGTVAQARSAGFDNRTSQG